MRRSPSGKRRRRSHLIRRRPMTNAGARTNLDEEFGWRVRAAHGDAWQADGRLRVPWGGGVAEVPGARLMATGLPAAKWNNADVTSENVDVDAVDAWYQGRDVPWGVRVPVEMDVRIGEPLFVKRCAGMVSTSLVPAPPVAKLKLRRASAADLETYARMESAGLEEDLGLTRRWLEPAIGSPGFGHWLVESASGPVAVGMTLRTDERAGPAVYLGGVMVLPKWQGLGVEGWLASEALAGEFSNGTTLAHFNPDDNEVAWATQLGFVEVPGFLVRVVRAGS